MLFPPPPHSSEKVYYPPVGKCIYCGDSESRLSDEHIIPFGLDGILVLQKSSCDDCAKVTSAFEGAVSNFLFGNFRIKHNLPSRRKKKRPTHLHAKAKSDQRVIEIPAADFPSQAFMYLCSEAGILSGLPIDLDTSSTWQPVVLSNHDEMVKFEGKYGKGIIFSFKHIPDSFARMLAKIAYCYAVAHLGLDGFRALALELILGDTKNISYLVGGNFNVPPAVPKGGHLLELRIETTDFNTALVVVGIRMFSSLETPIYHAVVGRIEDPMQTKAILSKFPEMHVSHARTLKLNF